MASCSEWGRACSCAKRVDKVAASLASAYAVLADALRHALMTDAPESATHRDQLEDARDLIVDAQNKIDDWRADPWDIDELESWLDSQQ